MYIKPQQSIATENVNKTLFKNSVINRIYSIICVTNTAVPMQFFGRGHRFRLMGLMRIFGFHFHRTYEAKFSRPTHQSVRSVTNRVQKNL